MSEYLETDVEVYQRCVISAWLFNDSIHMARDMGRKKY